MKTARISNSDNQQQVCIPAEYELEGDEVYVKKMDNILLLIPQVAPWTSLVNSLDKFSDDFMENRNEPAQSIRPDLA